MATKIKITKSLIAKIEKAPHDEGLVLKVDDLETLLEKAIEAYYNTDTPLFTDATYDILESILREKKPTSEIFKKVGAPIANPEDAVKLEYYMGSLDKVKPNEKSLTKWMVKYEGAKMVSEKLDGLSGLVIISLEDGDNIKMSLFKHGDGYEGQDISALLNYLNIGKYKKSAVIEYIKQQSKKHIALRGEIIISKDKYEQKYSTIYPKARSLISGIVNSKKYNTDIAKDMEIVFYEIIYPTGMKWSEQFAMIEKLGFNVAMNRHFDKLDMEALPELLLEFKRESHYEIDGIILADDTRPHRRVTSGNPEYAVAFKMALSEQIATTTVEYVEYNISKHGVLKPRICYKPVVIGGDTHRYTTGLNARYILDNKLGPNAEIQIIKSGDVIPYIYKIIKSAKEAQMPDNSIKWHWNETKVDVVLDDVENNEDVRTRKIVAFFEVMRVKGVGEGIIDRLVEASYDEVKSILELKPDMIANIEGFKLKSATNLYNAIHKVMDVAQPMERVMAASGVFSLGLGEKKFKLVIDNVPDFYGKWCAGKVTKDQLMAVEGYSDKSVEILLEGMPKFKQWMELHGNLVKIETADMKKSDVPKGNMFAGAVVVFTGIRNAELEKMIETQGGKVASSVSSKTTLLVAKDVGESSSKIEKAKELGVQIIAFDDFVKSL